jgi:hypothetical protein
MKLVSKAPAISMIVLASLATALGAGCGKSEPKKDLGDSLASAFASSMASAMESAAAQAAASAAASGGGGGANAGKVMGTCENKDNHQCTEYVGSISPMADDLCKGLDGKGVLHKEEKPCAAENAVGSCATAAENKVYYKHADNNPKDLKELCEGLMSGKWTPAAGAAPAGSAPAKGLPGKPAAHGARH